MCGRSLPISVPLAQQVARRCVIVHAEDVADGMLPAIVGNHGAGRVERASEVVQREYKVALLGRTIEIGHTPAFVQRHPGND
jgi:hypothetical protein